MHADLIASPEFRFRVVKCHRSPMDRMLHEAVRIVSSASMNSKSEHVGYKIARIRVEPSEWEAKKEVEAAEKASKCEEAAMAKIRDRTILNAPPPTNSFDSRKRKDPEMSGVESEPSPIVKRQRSDGKKMDKKQKKKVIASGSKSVLEWVLASKGRSSTPRREDLKSSTLEVNCGSPCSPATASFAVSGLGQACEDPGYSADVSSSNCSSKLSRPSNREEFDSTTSWFLENVDSYCLEENATRGSQNLVENEIVGEGELPQFDSTGSWFLDNVKDFQEKSQVVDHAPVLSASAPEMSIDMSQQSAPKPMSCSDGELCAVESLAESSSAMLCDSVELPQCTPTLEQMCGNGEFSVSGPPQSVGVSVTEFGPALPLAEKFTVKPTANMGENTVFFCFWPASCCGCFCD